MAKVARVLKRPLSRPLLVLSCASVALYVATCYYLQAPFDFGGDAPGYLEAMQVLNGMPEPATFTPNRFLTTFASVSVVALLASLTGNYLASWFFVNTFYFFGLAFVSYFLFRRLTGNETGSILGALFVIGSYDVLTFGLNYLMDIAGWFWFMLSLLFSYLYLEDGKNESRRYLWYAALAAGLGTLFKEYAFFAFLPLGACILYRHRLDVRGIIRDALPCVASLVPLLLVHAGVYLIYGYSYLDWYGMNTATFGFSDWAWNAGRSFLVVLGLILPVSVLGLTTLRSVTGTRIKLFTLSLVLPALAVFIWPIITERLVFLAVPLAALLAAFAIARYERHWPWFGFVWLLYVMVALRTDGLILNALYAL